LPDDEKENFEKFYKGSIYSSSFIDDSIASGKLKRREEYFLCKNSDKRAK